MAEAKPPFGDGQAGRAAKDIAFGTMSGMVSRLFEHPFDLCKVRLQAQLLDEKPRFKGPIDCLYQTWSKEGIRGLYRGLPAPLVGAMAEDAVLFTSYGQLLNALKRWYGQPYHETLPDGRRRITPPSLGQVAMAGAGAGAITSFVLTPIELVKCRMQVQMLAVGDRALSLASSLPSLSPSGTLTLPARPPPQPKFRELPGITSVVASILRTSGMRGLWLGQTGTIIREIGGCSIWFGANDVASRFFLRRRAKTLRRPAHEFSKADLKPLESVVAGAFAGVSACMICYPADTVKSSMQTEEELRPRQAGGAPRPKTTFLSTFRTIYTTQGIKGLYAGMGITLARSGPSSGLIFLLYDQLVKRFG